MSIIGEFYGGPRDGEQISLHPAHQVITVAVLIDELGTMHDLDNAPDEELRVATITLPVHYSDEAGKAYLVWPKQ